MASIYWNEVIFRTKKEFKEFKSKYIDENGNLDIYRFLDMPDCVLKTYIDNRDVNIKAATYFIMEELDIEMNFLSIKKVFNYIKKHQYDMNYGKKCVINMADTARNYKSIIKTKEENNFSDEEFYEYGKNAFQTFIEHNGLSKKLWRQKRCLLFSDAIDTTIDEKNLSIRWKIDGRGCDNLVQKSNIELYFRCIQKNGEGNALELWQNGKVNEKTIYKIHAQQYDINRYSIATAFVEPKDLGYTIDEKTGLITFDLTRRTSVPKTGMLGMFLNGLTLDEARQELKKEVH